MSGYDQKVYTNVSGVTCVESMDLRFKYDKEVQIAVRKLRQVKYTSNIMIYLDTHCYTPRINPHKGTDKAMAEALYRSLPHNSTQVHGITKEYVVSCTCYHSAYK